MIQGYTLATFPKVAQYIFMHNLRRNRQENLAQYIINRYNIANMNLICIICSCHITMPCAYEWVSNKCKCSGNEGADGLVPPVLVCGCKYSYSCGGASSYLGGNIGVTFILNQLILIHLNICRATTRPPRPWLTAECLRLIARLRET